MNADSPVTEIKGVGEKTKDLSSDKAFHKSDNNTGSKGNQYDNIYGSHSM